MNLDNNQNIGTVDRVTKYYFSLALAPNFKYKKLFTNIMCSLILLKISVSDFDKKVNLQIHESISAKMWGPDSSDSNSLICKASLSKMIQLINMSFLYDHSIIDQQR